LIYTFEGKTIVPAVLFLTGYLYASGVKVGKWKLRLKAGYGIKNIVVGFSWGFAVAFSLDEFVLGVFSFFFLKLFVNSAYFDLKDVGHDKILTLPRLLGRRFGVFLHLLNLLNHIVSFLLLPHMLIILSLLLIQLALMLEEKSGRRIIDSEAVLSVFAYQLILNCF